MSGLRGAPRVGNLADGGDRPRWALNVKVLVV